MYRAVMSTALIEAYRERALEVCRRQSEKPARTQAAHAAIPGAWSGTSGAEIVIGNAEIDVAIWDTENPAWSQRFRHPNLVLTSSSGTSPRRCSYDLAAGIATLSPL